MNEGRNNDTCGCRCWSRPPVQSMAAPCMKRRRAGAMWRKGEIRNEVDSDYRCHKMDCCVRCNLHFCLCDKGWKIPLVSSHPCIPDLSGGDGNMRDCSICKARAYCWEAVEPGSIMCGINLMQHGGTKSEPETPRSISVKLSPTFCAYCGKPLKIIGTERFCNNVQCFNRFQNV